MNAKRFVEAYQRNAVTIGLLTGAVMVELWRDGVPLLAPHVGWFWAMCIVGLIWAFVPVLIGNLVDKIWPLPQLTDLDHGGRP
jgi:hypothetical protein